MPHTLERVGPGRAGVDVPWESRPALQQPDWAAHPDYLPVRRQLAQARPLVQAADVAAARAALAAVALGSARVLQAGDCAESFADARRARTAAKAALLDRLADRLRQRSAQDVVRFGRVAGQYAKPRSHPVEMVDGVGIPPYRGDLVNSPEPDALARRHYPRRMLWAYEASARVHEGLHRHGRCPRRGPWASHEALVIDYESPLVRTDPESGERYLASTHFPWIGERTRQPDHAHVALLAAVANPVACKIGPTADPKTVVELCGLLDPERLPGRLTLIVRMGRGAVEGALPPLVAAVRRAGHPVIWLSDPMHGNTVRTKTGQKTRHLSDIIAEAASFRKILEEHRQHPGGLHLEVAIDDVTECVGGAVADEGALHARYESLCDPRLNLDQALTLIDAAC